MKDHPEGITFTGGFDAEAAATGPLECKYHLSSHITIDTKVFGPNRNQVAVCILIDNVTVWCCTMTPVVPICNVPQLIYLETTISEARFTLRPPSPIEIGMVFLEAEFSSNDGPSEIFKALVCSWPLNSAA